MLIYKQREREREISYCTCMDIYSFYKFHQISKFKGREREREKSYIVHAWISYPVQIPLNCKFQERDRDRSIERNYILYMHGYLFLYKFHWFVYFSLCCVPPIDLNSDHQLDKVLRTKWTTTSEVTIEAKTCRAVYGQSPLMFGPWCSIDIYTHKIMKSGKPPIKDLFGGFYHL